MLVLNAVCEWSVDSRDDAPCSLPAPCFSLPNRNDRVPCCSDKASGESEKLMSDEGVHSQNTVDVAKEPCLQSEGVVGCGLPLVGRHVDSGLARCLSLSISYFLLKHCLVNRANRAKQRAVITCICLP